MSLPIDDAALHGSITGRVLERDVLRIFGPDAASYLQGQCTQDVEALAVGSGAETLLLSPQGKVEAYLRVTRSAPDAFVLDTEAGFGATARARLERFKLRVKAQVEELDWRCVGLRGPQLAGGLPGVSSDALALTVAWGAVPGVDLLGPDVVLPDGVAPCGAAAWEAWRLEAGVPRQGAELDERTIPAEVPGLLERCVSFTKGCYTGQELVARLDARGNRVARHLRALVLGGEPPADESPDGRLPAPVPAGTELAVPGHDKVVGAVTSAAWSARLGGLALGFVHRDVAPGALLELRLPGAAPLSAEVRALPLIP